jgi:hypothetical protein
MDRRQRLTLLGVAAVIAVVAVVIALVAGGGDDSSDKSTSSTTAAQTGTGGDTSTTTTPAEPQGTTETIDIKGGQPDGGVKKIDATKNDPLQITVNSDQNVPIHFHGYDIEKPAAPGKPAVFKLKKANIDGVFEMEIESTKTKIASITVKP